MSRLLWLPDILSDAFRGVKGYQVDVVSGWNTRSARTTLFEPRGIMNHHTGGGSYAALLNYMTIGSSIAPLSQIASSRPHFIGGQNTVRITIMAAGRCNHAGVGHVSWTGTNGGNRYCIGFENQNDGSQDWPKQQLEGIWIANAAVLSYLKVGVERLTDHKTYAPGRKVDPHSLPLSLQQREVTKALQPKPKPIVKPDIDLEKLMANERLFGVTPPVNANMSGSGRAHGPNVRYKLIDDVSTPSGYAAKTIWHPSIADIEAGSDWRNHVVMVPQEAARRIKFLS